MLDDDPYPYFEYLTQNQIGRTVGVSAQQVGRWLTGLGLRKGKEPSADALASGLAKDVSDEGVKFFAWDKRRVLERLRQEGLVPDSKPVGPPESAMEAKQASSSEGLPGLVGPFASRSNAGDGYEILNGSGTTVAWTRGRGNASVFVRLLNLAHKCGCLK